MVVTLGNGWDLSIGEGQKLFCIMGLNVLEDLDLALEVGSYLKDVTDKLGLPYVFKASFDKANRSSIKSFRGPGLEKGLEILKAVKEELNVPVITDIHEPHQAEAIAEVVDIIQIPAFICRQTDLITATTKAAVKHNRLIHVKKAQFMAPWDCSNVITKIEENGGEGITILCERGSSFGYNNLVVDMLAMPEMKKLGTPVTIDATHAVQLPGADPRTSGESTGGRREGVSVIAKSAVAAGADGIFLEFHPEPDNAKCDALCCLPLSDAEGLLKSLVAIHAAR